MNAHALSEVRAPNSEGHGLSKSPNSGANAPAPFALTRWFALISLASIVLVSFVLADSLSRHLIKETLQRDGEITASFLQHFSSERAAAIFAHQIDSPTAANKPVGDTLPQNAQSLLIHLTHLPDVIHVNAYDPKQRLVWSSNGQAVGAVPGENEELQEALEGKVVVESEILERANHLKQEHLLLPNSAAKYFVENYVPIFNAGKQVIGIIELYRSPGSLFESVHKLNQRVWLSVLAGGAFLFFTLLWVVRRADRVLRRQQRQLVTQESLAAVGEVASAIAHGFRNPLSAIRTSAELLVDERNAPREESQDITSQVDRMESWIKTLLTYAHSEGGGAEPLQLDRLAKEALDGFERDMHRLGVRGQIRIDTVVPLISGNRALLAQVFNSLIANALEAMPRGGDLSIAFAQEHNKGCLDILVSDTGIGIEPERLGALFEPFQTNKKHGLGVGLTLAKRAIEQVGGTVEILSTVGQGTTVKLCIPVG